MSRVSELKQWKNSDTVNSQDYVLERERIRIAVNDNYERILGTLSLVTTSLIVIGEQDNYQTTDVGNYLIDTTLTNFNVLLPVAPIDGALVQYFIKAMGDTITFIGDTYSFEADETYEGVTVTYIYSSGEWLITTYSSNKHEHANYDFNKTGWEVYKNSQAPLIVFDNATRILTLTDAYGNGFWLDNVYHLKLVDAVTIPDVDGFHYIYYDETATLRSSMVPWGGDENTHVKVSTVFWRGAPYSRSDIVGFECHKWVMDKDTHAHFHLTFGTQYWKGYEAQFLNNTEMLYTPGAIRDEDIVDEHGVNIGMLQELNPLSAPHLWINGGGQWIIEESHAGQHTIAHIVDGVVMINRFNGVDWLLEPVANNKYFAVWSVATNDVNTPIMLLLGQEENNNLADAKEANTLERYDFGAITDALEFVVLDRIIMKRVGASYELIETESHRLGRANILNVTVGLHIHDDRYYTKEEAHTRSHLGDSAPLTPTLGGFWLDTTE